MLKSLMEQRKIERLQLYRNSIKRKLKASTAMMDPLEHTGILSSNTYGHVKGMSSPTLKQLLDHIPLQSTGKLTQDVRVYPLESKAFALTLQ